MSTTTRALRRNPARLLVASMLALGVALLLAGTASAQPAYHIVDKYSGKALMPAGGSAAWGTPVYQRTMQNTAAQHWFFNYEGNGLYSFKNRYSHYCIHPSNWSPVPAYLLQASCNTDNGARKWYSLYANGYYRFRSWKTGLYMDVEGSSMLDNALAIQKGYDGSSSQQWRLQYAGNY